MTTARSRIDLSRMDAALASLKAVVAAEARSVHHMECMLPHDHEGDCIVRRPSRVVLRAMKLPLIGGALMLALASLVGCSNATEQVAPVAQADAIAVTCGAHSFLSVGAYQGHWADWTLTVDTSGHSHASIVVVDGPREDVDGLDPALSLTLPGDTVAFDVWTADGRGHFVQPYPGLAAGYDVAIDCNR